MTNNDKKSLILKILGIFLMIFSTFDIVALKGNGSRFIVIVGAMFFILGKIPHK